MHRIVVQITALIAIMISVCCMESGFKFQKQATQTNRLLGLKKDHPEKYAALSAQLAKHKSQLEEGTAQKSSRKKLLLAKMRRKLTALTFES